MSRLEPNQVTELLVRWRDGDQSALQELVPLVYGELRRLAHHYLRSERPDHTLQSTALVHEAFLRLVSQEPDNLQNRAHFMAVASQLMRQIAKPWFRYACHLEEESRAYKVTRPPLLIPRASVVIAPGTSIG